MAESKINHAAVVLPFTQDGRVLLIRKDLGYIWNPGMWGFFGGRIESNERPDGLETLVRELGEEIGLVLPNIQFFREQPYFDVSPINGKRREGKLQAYISDFDGDLSKIRLKEGAGMSLWSPSEIWNLNVVPHNKDLIIEYYRAHGYDLKI